MTDRNLSQNTNQEAELSGCFVHLFWSLVGNFILILCLVLIFKKGFGAIDIVYWVTVGFMLIARYVDFKKFQGVTLEGKESTIQDWKKYRILLLGVSLLLWAGIHLLHGWVK
ncbi:MAG: hypothetical protein HUU50_22425 [Candidatus Brocadiae bacterium]|nr:hypothetical protein [Candidatus Brocadiia bacterium]